MDDKSSMLYTIYIVFCVHHRLCGINWFQEKRIIYQCIYNMLCQAFVQDMKRTSSHPVGSLIPVRNTGEAVTSSGALL